MSILPKYDIIGRTFNKIINNLFDEWVVVDYVGDNAYLIKGLKHGYQLTLETNL
jgi:hypothetical protein